MIWRISVETHVSCEHFSELNEFSWIPHCLCKSSCEQFSSKCNSTQAWLAGRNVFFFSPWLGCDAFWQYWHTAQPCKGLFVSQESSVSLYFARRGLWSKPHLSRPRLNRAHKWASPAYSLYTWLRRWSLSHTQASFFFLALTHEHMIKKINNHAPTPSLTYTPICLQTVQHLTHDPLAVGV